MTREEVLKDLKEKFQDDITKVLDDFRSTSSKISTAPEDDTSEGTKKPRSQP